MCSPAQGEISTFPLDNKAWLCGSCLPSLCSPHGSHSFQRARTHSVTTAFLEENSDSTENLNASSAHGQGQGLTNFFFVKEKEASISGFESSTVSAQRLNSVTAAGKKPAAAKSLQSCLTLCDPIDGSPAGSSVPGILQARTLEWVAISVSNACMHAKSLQSHPTLCYPMDSSPAGSSIHWIL